MKITSLNIYPVKSCGGYGVLQASLSDRGFVGDRRWVLVDQNGIAITQRQVPVMALIAVEDRGREFFVRNLKDGSAATFEKESYSATEGSVDIFGTLVAGRVVSAEMSSWFSSQIGQPCQLLYMPDTSHRHLKEKHQDPSHSTIVSFVDAHQYLVISESSLADLSQRVGMEIGMERFRPNIVVDGSEPFAEDGWNTLRIGSVLFHKTKACGRCKITTVDQQTGEVGKEPLRTLSKFRKFGSSVHFGIYLRAPLAEIGNAIQVGDAVEVLG